MTNFIDSAGKQICPNCHQHLSAFEPHQCPQELGWQKPFFYDETPQMLGQIAEELKILNEVLREYVLEMREIRKEQK